MTSLGDHGISVVIPTHDGRESVAATVRSLLSQADEPFEIIVVTDGDGTRTREVLAELADNRLTIIERPKAGSAATRNAGLAAARYDWVAFVDDDDTPRNNWVVTFRRYLDDSVNAVTAGLALWRGDRLIQTKVCRLDPDDKTLAASTIMAGAFIIRRTVLNAVDGYDTALRAAQNQDLGLRICDHAHEHRTPGRWLRADEVVIDVYAQEARERQARYRSAYADSARLFLTRYADRLAYDPRATASLLRIISRVDRLDGDHRSARRLAFSAVRTEPRNIANARSLILAWFPALSSLRAIRAAVENR